MSSQLRNERNENTFIRCYEERDFEQIRGALSESRSHENCLTRHLSLRIRQKTRNTITGKKERVSELSKASDDDLVILESIFCDSNYTVSDATIEGFKEKGLLPTNLSLVHHAMLLRSLPRKFLSPVIIPVDEEDICAEFNNSIDVLEDQS